VLNIDLVGRRAFVTGAARGIGAAIVRILAYCGAEVAFTYLGSEGGRASADRLVADLQNTGHRVIPFIAPAEDMKKMTHVVAEAGSRMGGIDIVVPNVGVTWVAPLEDLDLEGWQRALDLNLTSTYILTKLALPWLLRAQKSNIVIIGSSAAIDGGGGGAHYAAAKAALEGFVRALVRELPFKGININLIHPCVIDTGLLRERYSDEEKRSRLASQVPVGRLGRPEDVAYLVAFLCSDLADFICGQSILIDGGRTFGR
jgi:3-oxoacyl-[acyl-carrier protein] reductase